MNIAMFCHFFSIMLIFGTILLYYFILTIMLTFVVSIKLWLIIRWISIRLCFIIWLIVFSKVLPIVILFSLTKNMCLWNHYIYDNWWKTCTCCWSSTDIYNLFIFNRWFFEMIINIFGIVLCTVKWPLLLLLLLLEILKHNCVDKLKMKEAN